MTVAAMPEMSRVQLGGMAVTTVEERWSASWDDNVRLARIADDPAEFLRAFSAWLFSRRAHENGFAERWVQEALEDPHAMGTEDFCAAAAACMAHDGLDRLR